MLFFLGEQSTRKPSQCLLHLVQQTSHTYSIHFSPSFLSRCYSSVLHSTTVWLVLPGVYVWPLFGGIAIPPVLRSYFDPTQVPNTVATASANELLNMIKEVVSEIYRVYSTCNFFIEQWKDSQAVKVELIKGTNSTPPCTRPRVFLLTFLETNSCLTLYPTLVSGNN